MIYVCETFVLDIALYLGNSFWFKTKTTVQRQIMLENKYVYTCMCNITHYKIRSKLNAFINTFQ